MEKLEQIKRTLSEIDHRVPDALPIALPLGCRLSPTPAPGEDDELATFAASLLQPPATGDDVAAASLEQLDDVLAAPEQDGDGHPAPAEPDDAPPTLRMRCGSCYVPLHDHDAHFVGHAAGAGAGVLGVADGVGGYMLLGVDAGAFSRGLVDAALAAVDAAEPGKPVCPYALLELAYEQTAAAGTPGASTAVVLSLAGGALRWAYIGDSGFAVLRGGRTVRRSAPQRHEGSNAPFQLSSNSRKGDSVTLASTGEAAARGGDVVGWPRRTGCSTT
ncbi:hypothetical protein ACP4OV_006208 [Aristida adscensionis]